MATKQNITVVQGDDPVVALTVLSGLTAANLTGKRVEILVKTKSTTPDSAALYTLSSQGSSPKVAITDATNGLATADFSDHLATAGKFWYHAYVSDVADATLNRHTFSYGYLEIIAV